MITCLLQSLSFFLFQLFALQRNYFWRTNSLVPELEQRKKRSGVSWAVKRRIETSRVFTNIALTVYSWKYDANQLQGTYCEQTHSRAPSQPTTQSPPLPPHTFPQWCATLRTVTSLVALPWWTLIPLSPQKLKKNKPVYPRKNWKQRNKQRMKTVEKKLSSKTFLKMKGNSFLKVKSI